MTRGAVPGPESEPLAAERLSWVEWQRAVVHHLRKEFSDLLPDVGMDDIDWGSWQPFYTGGYAPRAAINRALERD